MILVIEWKENFRISVYHTEPVNYNQQILDM